MANDRPGMPAEGAGPIAVALRIDFARYDFTIPVLPDPGPLPPDSRARHALAQLAAECAADGTATDYGFLLYRLARRIVLARPTPDRLAWYLGLPRLKHDLSALAQALDEQVRARLPAGATPTPQQALQRLERPGAVERALQRTLQTRRGAPPAPVRLRRLSEALTVQVAGVEEP